MPASAQRCRSRQSKECQGVGVALFKRPRQSFCRLSVGIRVVSKFVHAGGGAGHLTAVMSICLHVHTSVVPCTLMSPSCGVACCAARYGQLAAGRGTILRDSQCRSTCEERGSNSKAFQSSHDRLQYDFTPRSPERVGKRHRGIWCSLLSRGDRIYFAN
jgi:hypothetical protein